MVLTLPRVQLQADFKVQAQSFMARKDSCIFMNDFLKFIINFFFNEQTNYKGVSSGGLRWGFAFRLPSRASPLAVHDPLLSQVSGGIEDGLRAQLATLACFLCPVTPHHRPDGFQRRLILAHSSSSARSKRQTVPDCGSLSAIPIQS